MKKGGLRHNNHRSIYVYSGLRAPEFRIRPRPCPISGVHAKIIIIFIIWVMSFINTSSDLQKLAFCEISSKLFHKTLLSDK